nr:hypothetical protein [Specibacter cremeus]
MTTAMWWGTRATNRARSPASTIVPVGLFGLQTKMTRVLSVTAAAIARRSWRCPVSGTGTAVAPAMMVALR